MAELADGETTRVKGSGSAIYELKNVGGVYSCSCPAWRNQGVPHQQRSCKHLKAFRGAEAEAERLSRFGACASPPKPESSALRQPPLLLAHSWDNQQDLSGWWMSEKLDGVRAWWDGERLVSRQGNVFLAPAWFREQLPAMVLDGELWAGRKQFQRCVSIVRSGSESERWKEVRFLVFDGPDLPGTFEERSQRLREVLEQGSSAVAWHPHECCQDLDHLRRELRRVEELGGEGLMLRQPGSRYEAGRSTTLLKVKRFLDAEARVVGHQPGAGRHLGRLGALLVELPDGTRFSVGTGFSDRQRQEPPPVGAQITFRYQELTEAGVPRFPTFVAERWEGDPAWREPVRQGLRRAVELADRAQPAELRRLLEELLALLPPSQA